MSGTDSVPAVEVMSVEKTYPNGTQALLPVDLFVRLQRRINPRKERIELRLRRWLGASIPWWRCVSQHLGHHIATDAEGGSSRPLTVVVHHHITTDLSVKFHVMHPPC